MTRKDRLCKHISLQTVHSICKSLVRNNGDHHAAYEDTKHLVNVTLCKVYDIKYKRSYPSISDEYFKMLGNKFIPVIESPINIPIDELKDRVRSNLMRMTLDELIGVVFTDDVVSSAIEEFLNKTNINELIKMAR